MSNEVSDALAVAGEELRRHQREIARLREQAADPGTWGVRVLDSLPVAVLLLDESGTVLHANRASGEVLGSPSLFVVGKPFAAFVGLGSRPAFRRVWSEVVRSGGEHRVEVRLSSNGAVQVPAHLTLAAQAEIAASRRVRCVAVPCTGPASSFEPGDGDGGQSLRLARAIADIASLPLRCAAVPELLSQAAEAAARAVPGAAGASLSLAECGTPTGPESEPALAEAVCSSPVSEAAETLQRETRQGPTYEAARTRHTLVSENLRTDLRWPALGRRLASHGLGGAAAAPLREGDDLAGVLTVWWSPGALHPGSEVLVRPVAQACRSAVRVAQELHAARTALNGDAAATLRRSPPAR